MMLTNLFRVILIAVMSLATLVSGCTTMGIEPRFSAEVSMMTGEKVRLFYGGTQEGKNIFCIGETVPVYRSYWDDGEKESEVGKVRITNALDDQYLEGVVVEGAVMDGDLARKSIAACMIRPLRMQR